MRYRKPFFKRQHSVAVGVGIGVGVASASAAASASVSASALALRGEGWRGVAWRGEAAWRVSLIRTDTTLDHSQKAEMKRDSDITGKGDTLRAMALALALHRRWRWR